MSNASHEMCPLAFHQLYIHSSGEVYPCAFVQGKYSIGNINEKSLDEIWNDTKATNFREDHKNSCNEYCQSNQKKYNCHLLHPNIELNTQKERNLKRLDIMIDSFCNLKCIMCTNRTEVNGGFLNENFWQELEKNILPQINEIELVGGEPLIAKDSYKLMDLVINTNPNIKWVITTNGHLDFNENMKSRIKKLNIHSFAVSIDSLDAANFKKIRVDGNLTKTMNFLNNLKSYKKENDLNFYLVCNFLIQRDNWHELEDFIKFQNDNDITVYPKLLREPIEFSIFTLPYQDILTILDSYLELAQKYKNYYIAQMCHKISKALKKEDLISRVDLLNQLGKYE